MGQSSTKEDMSSAKYGGFPLRRADPSRGNPRGFPFRAASARQKIKRHPAKRRVSRWMAPHHKSLYLKEKHPCVRQVSGHGFSRAAKLTIKFLPCAAGPRVAQTERAPQAASHRQA